MARLWLLVFLLAVPVVAYVVGAGVRGHDESDWSTVVVRELGQADANRSGILALEVACSTPRLVSGGLAGTCDRYRQVGLLKGGALLAGLASVGLLALIHVAGQSARRSRERLLRLFEPGLHLTVWTLTGLVLVDAVLAIAALYVGETAVVGRLHLGIILAIGLGAPAGAGALIQASRSVVRSAESSVLGVRIDPVEQPSLVAVVEDLARELGAERPEHIVIGLEPNYYVIEATVRHLDAVCSGRTLFLSLPLSRLLLSRGELRAILGHELGHFRGLDTRFSQHFFPIYRGSADALGELGAVLRAGGARAISVLPALAVMSYF
jgi:Zn-dependent protease with chaperone function